MNTKFKKWPQSLDYFYYVLPSGGVDRVQYIKNSPIHHKMKGIGNMFKNLSQARVAATLFKLGLKTINRPNSL